MELPMKQERGNFLPSRIQIGTTIGVELWRKCKAENFKWNFLIERGFSSIKGFEALKARLAEAERQAENWKANFENMRRMAWEQEERLKKLEEHARGEGL